MPIFISNASQALTFSWIKGMRSSFGCTEVIFFPVNFCKEKMEKSRLLFSLYISRFEKILRSILWL